ncbi:MAG: N-acetylmuramoyl-L-alanine amidase [Hyphomicrobiales bacterium]|nr:N-acetylmuramoyl-L-alanine amidase [Hyphomicrobiales bacterium]
MPQISPESCDTARRRAPVSSLARLALGLVLAALCGSPASAREEAGAPPVSTSAHIDLVLDQTRLVFDLSSPVEADAFVMVDPDRVIIDLPEVNFQLDPRAGQTQPRTRGRRGAPAPKATTGVISSYRFGLFAPGKSRIVIDLAKPARVVRAITEAGPDGRHRLQIDLAPIDAATFRRTARATVRDLPVDRPAAAKPEATAAADARPLVVIDPGHGGIDSGAQGIGSVIEKTLVFDFSKILEGQLKESGKYRVQLTRNADVFVSLADRVKFARDANAALFISIHADTISEAAGVSGATVYTVSDKASDAQAAKLAEKENDADSAAGLGGTEDGADVSDILFDLTRRETRAYSHVFARSLVNYWSQAGRLNKNPMRSAGFLVLKAPDVPSVLLELGYLSSEKDIAALMKPQWREKAAGAIAEAIDKFFAPRIGAGDAAPERLPDGVAAAKSEQQR